MPKCVFHDLPRFFKAENSRSTMERTAVGANRAMLAMLGLSALMLGVTGTSQAQGFTITSTPTFASTNVGSTSAAANVVVQTTGTTTITGITVPNSANGSPQFNYKSISGCTIGSAAAGGTNCTISITFSPAFPGVQTAPLVIA